jgi:hypothetical protein
LELNKYVLEEGETLLAANAHLLFRGGVFFCDGHPTDVELMVLPGPHR